MPVLNKMDLPQADTDRVKEEIEKIIGIDATDAVACSAKSGMGVDEADRNMLGLARHTVNLWANYRFAAASTAPGAGAFNLGAGINARSRLDYQLPGINITQRNPGAARIDVVLGYDTRLWSLKLGVRNLADRVLFSTGSTIAAAEVEPRRMVTLTGTYKF